MYSECPVELADLINSQLVRSAKEISTEFLHHPNYPLKLPKKYKIWAKNLNQYLDIMITI